MKSNLICILCPNGCMMEVELENNKIKTISGNSCKRGEKYALEELTAPKRVLTAIVKVENGETNVTSVKTNGSIPKEMLIDVLNEINVIKVKAPVKIGDILIKDVLNTGVDVVVTRNA